jgi:hypothetical protein
MDKDFHLMRLEKTQTWLAAGLTIALFAGLPILPYWGQVVWVALMGAAWLRVVIVIMRKEKLVNDSGRGTPGYGRPEGGVGVADGEEEPRVLPDHVQRRIDTHLIDYVPVDRSAAITAVRPPNTARCVRKRRRAEPYL